MVEHAASFEPSQQKRRSTRIIQAVPITVIGTDALGQPFKERTSTLVINSHGCRYQSKHYVLKNRWVTFEIPSPHQGEEPRRVRGRVIFIQRPRTVRELFQIGAELEVPGNVWGIAFPPLDWFQYEESEAPAAEIPAPSAEPELLPQPAEDKVRTIGTVESEEVSAAMSRQMARLMAEARTEIAHAVREAAASAVPTEAHRVMAHLTDQLQAAAGRAVDDVISPRLVQGTERALERIEQAGEACAEELDRRLRKQFEEDIQRAAEQAEAQLGELARQVRSEFFQQVEAERQRALAEVNDAAGRVETLRSSAEQAAIEVQQRIEKTRAEVEAGFERTRSGWRERLDAVTGEALQQLTELEQATRKLQQEIFRSTSEAAANWRGELEAELEAAGTRWDERVESSISAAAERMAARLGEVVELRTAQADRDLAARVAAARASLEAATEQAAEKAGAARAALDAALSGAQSWLAQIEARASELERRASEVAAQGDRLVAELDRRFEAILEAQRLRLDEHAESLIAAAIERMQPAFDAAGQHSVAQFVGEVERQIAPHVEDVTQAVARLTAAQQTAEELWQDQQRRLAEAAELTAEGALARMRTCVEKIHTEAEEKLRAAMAAALSELDTKIDEVSHQAFESLFKTSEWYQRKAQTGMQAAVEKGIEQATAALRDKAAEVSRMFAAEMDRYSRNYAEHTREQTEDAVNEIIEKTRAEIAALADQGSVEFSERVQRTAEEHARRLGEASSAALDHAAQELAVRSTQTRTEIESRAAEASAEWEQRLALGIEQAVAEARRRIESGLSPAFEQLRAERRAQEHALEQALEQASAATLEDFRQRLENVSNSWMLASATTLTQRSQAALDEMAKRAEKRLREVTTAAVAELADSLRQRLLGLPDDLTAAAGSSE